jgi:hypothetical protein
LGGRIPDGKKPTTARRERETITGTRDCVVEHHITCRTISSKKIRRPKMRVFSRVAPRRTTLFSSKKILSDENLTGETAEIVNWSEYRQEYFLFLLLS